MVYDKLMFRTGDEISEGNGSYSSRLPDVIGCKAFGKRGSSRKYCCTIQTLKTQFQRSNEDLLGEMLVRAINARMTNTSEKKTCDLMSCTHDGKHCTILVIQVASNF